MNKLTFLLFFIYFASTTPSVLEKLLEKRQIVYGGSIRSITRSRNFSANNQATPTIIVDSPTNVNFNSNPPLSSSQMEDGQQSNSGNDGDSSSSSSGNSNGPNTRQKNRKHPSNKQSAGATTTTENMFNYNNDGEGDSNSNQLLTTLAPKPVRTRPTKPPVVHAPAPGSDPRDNYYVGSGKKGVDCDDQGQRCNYYI